MRQHAASGPFGRYLRSTHYVLALWEALGMLRHDGSQRVWWAGALAGLCDLGELHPALVPGPGAGGQ